ncbi:S-layer homology domain-containing protein [Alkaliphilus peptidifermentans]|uniref:S-layer homology domain-containing protein n=1 Tax=Alkaliphilus peptidifermentans DSM 18978 TaxID=1120976 RepID=A0A1G5ADS0_9FIRM|nr:S-layer homology domain-containing protein [Alkaliphilus peptidifermentans]SCX76028.1 S-layer homology domain-containing protein [Alkaliphilus peptidifermentans DSM 18978]
MHKKHLTLVLAFVMILVSSISALGQGLVFTDIEGHWAREYIEDIYSRKLTTGYVDATYRPNNSITGLEAVVMLANLLGYDAQANQASASQVKLYTDNKIPAWSHGYLAYLMDMDIVMETELSGFVLNGLNTNIKRFEFANFIGRILVNYAGEAVSRSYLLPYKDEMSIPADTKPYVDLMLKKDLLNAASNDGRFLPNNEITRGEIAKLVSLTADILDGVIDDIVNKKPNEEEKPKEEEKPIENPKPDNENENGQVSNGNVTYKEGMLENLAVAGNRTSITIKSNNTVLIYDVRSDVIVYLDEVKSNLEALKPGQDVKLKLVSDLVVEIEAVDLKELYQGYFERFHKGTTNTVLSLRDLNGENKVFTLPDDIEIYLDNKEATLNDFKLGDVVRVMAKDDRLVEIRGKSKLETVKGVISYLGTPNNPIVEITKSDDTVVRVELETDSTIRRDARTVGFTRLRLSDEVTVQLEYDRVKTLSATTVRRKVEGYLRKIVISDEEEYIELETTSNEKEQFFITVDTRIWEKNRLISISDLRINHYAELEIESNEVVRLTTSERLEQATMIGTISYIHKDLNIIEVIQTVDGEDIAKNVSVKTNTIYIRQISGNTAMTNFTSLKVGDVLSITGQTNKGVFTADIIIVTSASPNNN